MKVYSSVGHVGRWWVPGYIKPPAVAYGRREDTLALRVAAAFTCALIEAGHQCAVRGAGTYGKRQREAKGAGADLYVSHHWNAGPDPDKDYGLILYTPGAAGHASGLADALSEFSNGARRVVMEPLDAERWGPGPSALLETFSGPAVLIEPGFLTSAGSATLYQAGGPEALGRALAAGLAAVG